jgi:hypothetical protein
VKVLRFTIASLTLGLCAVTSVHSPARAWPVRAVSLGGELVTPVGPSGTRQLRRLARNDTLSAVTPADYGLDPAGGPVVFFTAANDSVRVVVGRNPFGATDRVTAQGRRLTVRLANSRIVIDSK